MRLAVYEKYEKSIFLSICLTRVNLEHYCELLISVGIMIGTSV